MLTIIAGILLTIPMLMLLALLVLVLLVNFTFWVKSAVSTRRLKRLGYED